MKLYSFLERLSNLLFPNRAQVDYLKAQVAYHQRRADVLEARLVAILSPANKPERKAPPVIPPAKTGWEAYRTKARETNDRSEEAAQSDAAPVAQAG